MTLFIIAIVIALTISCFCSMLEACLLSLSNSDLARIAEKHPGSARIWKSFKSNIQKPLAVILIINTFAHTIGASVSGAQFNKLFGNKWIAAYSIIFSLIMIQWTEILPKSLSVRYNKVVAKFTAVPFNITVLLFRPVVIAIEWLNRPFEGRNKEVIESSVSDIRVLARSAFLEHLISKEQERLISRSVLMSTLTARDVMIDRSDINFLSCEMTLQEGLLASHIHRHTRFPLTEKNDLDHIVGYVNFKDIVGALHVNPGDPTLRGVTRPVVFVSETTRLPDLLTKLTRGYQHIAIVQDESKRTMGLVTLENIVETLLGDLQDEYDTPPDFIVQLAEHRFRVGGNTTFCQVKARALSSFPSNDDITIDAWIKKEIQGNDPVEGITRRLGDITIKVRRVVRGNVHDVIIEQAAAPSSPASPPTL
jgi:putative hemolysin